jgi:hypothetical protein
MAGKKSSGTRKRKTGKKESAASVRNLINDAIRDPGIRSALYKSPRAVAKKYGLTNEEGKAMEVLKRSLLSSLGRDQVDQLEAIIGVSAGGWGGGGCPPVPPCGPTTVCNPNCLPTCIPNPCAPPCAPRTL